MRRAQATANRCRSPLVEIVQVHGAALSLILERIDGGGG